MSSELLLIYASNATIAFLMIWLLRLVASLVRRMESCADRIEKANKHILPLYRMREETEKNKA